MYVESNRHFHPWQGNSILGDEVIKKVVIVIKSDKKLLWDVFNIERPEWSVDCGINWHVVRQLPSKRHEPMPDEAGE